MGPRGKRKAERDMRAMLEQVFEAKVRDPMTQKGKLAARQAMNNLSRQTGR